jgi:hypothetical protein
MFLSDTPYTLRPNSYSYTYPAITLYSTSKKPNKGKFLKPQNGAQTTPSVKRKKNAPVTAANFPLIPISERQQQQQLAALTGSSPKRADPRRSTPTLRREDEEKEEDFDFDEKGFFEQEDSMSSMGSPVDDTQIAKKRKSDSFDGTSPLRDANGIEGNFSERIIEALRGLGGKGTGKCIILLFL